MHSLFIFIETHPVLISLFAGACPLLIPQVRRIFVRFWRWLRGDHQKQAVIDKLDYVVQALDRNGIRLEGIEKEIKFNGGKSIKDMLFLLFRYREHDFWRIGIPAFELDGDAQMILVSEAACRLFGVSSQEELKRRSWLRFIGHVGADGTGSVDDFLSAYHNTVQFQSEFLISLRITTAAGKSCGEWELRGSPISQENATTKIYSCHLSPASDLARDAARVIQYGCPLICKPKGESPSITDIRQTA